MCGPMDSFQIGIISNPTPKNVDFFAKVLFTSTTGLELNQHMLCEHKETLALRNIEYHLSMNTHGRYSLEHKLQIYTKKITMDIITQNNRIVCIGKQ